jgi:predicted metal-dependent TIM-barrel fold hydrolase
MSKETKGSLEAPVPYKSVLIIGSDTNIPKDISDLYKQKGYLLIGDGNKNLQSLDLEPLKGNISPDTKINFYAHGIAIKGIHYVDGNSETYTTGKFLAKIAQYSPTSPLNIHQYSCYCGAAAPDVKVLPEGSTFVAHGESEMISSGSADRIIYQSNKDLRITKPALEFASNFLRNIGQMATFTINNGIVPFKHPVRSPKKILSKLDEIIRYFTAERLNFVTEYNKCFPSSTIDLESLPVITPEEALEWKKNFNEYSLTGPNSWTKNASYGKEAEQRIINELKAYFDLDVINEDITKLPCFGNEVIVTTFEYLQQVYDKGSTSEEKKENAQRNLNLIRDLDSKEKISLVLDYGFDPIKLKDADCLKYSVAETALKYIKIAFDKGSTLEAKKTNASIALKEINDIVHPGKITAIMEYGLDIAQVKDARCLEYEVAEALKYIKVAFDRGSTPEAKKTNASIALKQINDIIDPGKITAIMEYGLDSGQVKDAKCLEYYGAKAALKYIKIAFDRGSTPEAKKTNASIALKEINDIVDPGKITAIMEYGLDSGQVKDAKCFENYLLADKVLENMKKVHDENPDSEMRQIKLQELFHKIKDLVNERQLKAVIEHGLDPLIVINAKQVSWDKALDDMKDDYNKSSIDQLRKCNQKYRALSKIEQKNWIKNYFPHMFLTDYNELKDTQVINPKDYKNIFNTGIYPEVLFYVYDEACKGNTLMVPLLKEVGFNFNAQDEDGKTIVHIAAEKRDIELLKKLKEAGADINAKDRNGSTALIKAVYNYSSDKSVEALVKLGADINVKNDSGQNAIGQVYYSPYYFKALVKSGIKPDIEINYFDGSESKSLFKTYLNDPLGWLIKNNATVEIILNKIIEKKTVGVNEKHINDYKQPLLEEAIKQNNFSFIEQWISKHPKHFNDNNMAKSVIDLCDNNNQMTFAQKANFLSGVTKAYKKSWRSDVDIKGLDACEDRLRHNNTEYLLVSENKEKLDAIDNSKATKLLQQAITEKDFAFMSRLADKADFVVEMNDNLKSQIIKFAKDNFANIEEHPALEKQLEILDVLQKLDKKTSGVMKIPLYPDNKKTLSTLITEEIDSIKHILNIEPKVSKDVKSNLIIPVLPSQKTIDGLKSVRSILSDKSPTISVITTRLQILKSPEIKGNNNPQR